MVDEPRPVLRAILVTLALIAALLGGAWYLGGRTGLEKTATSLALPLGVCWTLLVAGTVASLSRRHWGTALLVFLALLMLTAVGNRDLAARLAGPLEAPYAELEDGEVATAVVLGGGVWETPAGRAEGNTAGDRVLRAAALHRAGRVQSILCTGALPDDVSRLSRPEGEIARDLLVALGVPEADVSLGGGANTSEEVALLAEAVEEGDVQTPLGIITSAWHMDRVERLAEAAGLEFTPLPADFRTGGRTPEAARVISIVPEAGALQLTTLAVREHLAAMADR